MCILKCIHTLFIYKKLAYMARVHKNCILTLLSVCCVNLIIFLHLRNSVKCNRFLDLCVYFLLYDEYNFSNVISVCGRVGWSVAYKYKAWGFFLHYIAHIRMSCVCVFPFLLGPNIFMRTLYMRFWKTLYKIFPVAVDAAWNLGKKI